MPMSPRLLRPIASGIGFPIAEARDGSNNVIAATDYTDANGQAWRAHIFTQSGTLNFTRGGQVEYLIVAGGGSGARSPGAGGGGAGGLIEGSGLLNGSVTVTVGAGGAAPTSNGVSGANGSNSLLGSVEAIGGGGGGRVFGGTSPSGGSGGGGGAANGFATNGGSGTAAQGNSGGDAVATFSGNNAIGGAGGGGASAAGSSNQSQFAGGPGGAGKVSSISGASVTYAGGGGGRSASGSPAPGGSGGGGAGGVAGAAVSGTSNSGGGGGGATDNQTPGNGGSGIVVVRYRYQDSFVPTQPWDSDALAYIEAVQIADGNFILETGVRDAINDFIVGCKADGIWSAIKASCILMGARTLSGALTPLVGAAPTNNNFVSGDYNRKTGLAGNASTKWLNTNRAGSADSQNSNHRCVYVSSAGSPSNATHVYLGNFDGNGSSNIGISSSQVFFRNNGLVSQFVLQGASSATGFMGSSRSSSASFAGRVSGSNTTHSVSSSVPTSLNILIGRDTSATSPLFTNARFAFYSLGDSVTLSSLDSRVTTLYNAIGAAI